MERLDLKSTEGLKTACAEAEASHANLDWRQRLRLFIEKVHATPIEGRSDEGFQRLLWEDNPVSATGMGSVRVEKAISDPEFRQWLAEQSTVSLPEAADERTAALSSIHKEALRRLEPLCDRTPYLKLFRIWAVFFPMEFTTLAAQGSLQKLLIKLGVPRKIDPVVGHRKILDRLADVLGPIDPSDTDALVRRMTLPWMLIELITATDPDTTSRPSEPGDETLRPLPPTRRFRGLTAITGYFEGMLPILEFVDGKPTPEELVAFIREEKPHLKESSIRTYLNALRSQFNVLIIENDRYVLTDRGKALREAEDPDELRDWLLTRILGFDHVLAALKQHPLSRDQIFALLKEANPGWTSNFAPSGMLQWFVALDLVSKDNTERYSLTDRGKSWSEWITWRPENLSARDDKEVTPKIPTAKPDQIERPGLGSIRDQIISVAAFSPGLVTSLHLGLWSNERRHFAILTGLSGSGKTLLAREYGKALTGAESGTSPLLCTIPVQPGWYDPSPLLGYVNPLSRDTYESTQFLNLLIHAVENPQLPHVAILDEMNLSHPEQYLAPILSAMETDDFIELHTKGDHFDGVPSQIPYPSNLVLIGTVNMDETTLGLSDKVLDRAYTLEFWDIDVDQWPGWGSGDVPAADQSAARGLLQDLMAALAPARLHFGWRVIQEVIGFLRLRHLEGDDLSITDALDQVVYAKLLPKLRGDDSLRFRDALEACKLALDKHGLNASAAKVAELQDDLAATGSARFWR